MFICSQLAELSAAASQDKQGCKVSRGGFRTLLGDTSCNNDGCPVCCRGCEPQWRNHVTLLIRHAPVSAQLTLLELFRSTIRPLHFSFRSRSASLRDAKCPDVIEAGNQHSRPREAGRSYSEPVRRGKPCAGFESSDCRVRVMTSAKAK